MKRFALILATLAILCVSAGQVQAHGHHGHGGYHGGYHHGGYHRSYYAPVVVRPRIVAPPVVVVPPRAYPPVYGYRCYAPRPASGFYYQGPGLSIGVGF